MTTAELITQTRTRFGEDSTTATQVTDAQILSFLNVAQRELCAETNLLLSCWTSSTVAGQEDYSVPSDYHKAEAVFLYKATGANTKTRLRPIGILDRDPSLAQGEPMYYYIWGVNVSGNNQYKFGLRPIPIESGTDDLRIWARQMPKDMVSGGQAPEVKDVWQDALVDGCLMLLYLRLAPGDSMMLQLADRAAARWGSRKKEAEDYISVLTLDEPRMPRDTMGYTSSYMRY